MWSISRRLAVCHGRPFAGVVVRTGKARWMGSKKNDVSFKSLGVSGVVVNELLAMGVKNPTEVQEKTIPRLLSMDIERNLQPNPELATQLASRKSDKLRDLPTNGRSIVVASETGSGKTLAFLLPIFELIKKEEALSGMETRKARPKAIVLCPTRELALQISIVAKQLSHAYKARVSVLTGGIQRSKAKRTLQNPIDLLICTPRAALGARDNNTLYLGSVKHIILDEADTLLGDRDFVQEFHELTRVMELYGSALNFVFVGATILSSKSRSIADVAKASYGRDRQSEFSKVVIQAHCNDRKRKFEVVRSSSHGLLPEGIQIDVEVGNETSKHPTLLSLLRRETSNRVIVFTNSINSARSTNHTLEDEMADDGVGIYSVHGQMPPAMRERQMKAFLSDTGMNDGSHLSIRKKILVTTDAGSRGLDIKGATDVICFDLPSSLADFIHRVGRSGRMGAQGRVTLLSRGTNKDERLINILLASVPRKENAPSETSSAQERVDFTAYRTPTLRHTTKHARLKRQSKPVKRFVAITKARDT
mmetsp:Transcript_10033/g.17623  ORF Transcript_10033/g.17623 Transcript_10033/m.17623 type:complete len:535 (-) Transcript_10033:575-2179(-)